MIGLQLGFRFRIRVRVRDRDRVRDRVRETALFDKTKLFWIQTSGRTTKLPIPPPPPRLATASSPRVVVDIGQIFSETRDTFCCKMCDK